MRIAILFTFGFWLFLLLAGFPPPMVDDLYFIGAPIHMVRGGDFTNPFCPGLAHLGASDHFFVCMPLGCYALAGWLDLFGINRISLVSFQALACAFASVALLLLIDPPEKGWSRLFYAAAISLAVAIFASALGFRPDDLSLAFFCLGLLILKARTLSFWFCASLSLFLCGLTSPNFGILVPLVFVYALFFHHGTRSLALHHRLILVLLSALVATGLFLWMIGGEIDAFLTIFNNARKDPTFQEPLGAIFATARETFRFFIRTFFPALSAAVLIGIAWKFPHRFQKSPGKGALLFLALATLVVLWVEFSSGTGDYLAGLGSMVLALFFYERLRSSDRPWGVAFLGLVFAILFFDYGRTFLQLALCPGWGGADNASVIRAQLEELKPTHIYIDSAAAWRLYDYRIPENSADNNFGVNGVWQTYPQAEDLPADSALAISTQTALRSHFYDVALKQPGFRFVPVRFFSKLYPQTARNPFVLVLIPHADEGQATSQ